MVSRDETIRLLITVIIAYLYFSNYEEIHNFRYRSKGLKCLSKDIFIDRDSIEDDFSHDVIELMIDNMNETFLKNLIMIFKKYTEEELVLLKRNLPDLKFEKRVLNFNIGGGYNPEKNMIAINNNCDDDQLIFEVLNHELHHVASNLGIVDDVVLVGFQQKHFNKRIGVGLNEAYTEYLSVKMLDKKIDSYKGIVELIPLIEELFEDKLEIRKAYFRADLNFIIKKFDEFYSHEESLELISDIDKLMYYDTYRSWFNKSNLLDIKIRNKLYEYYQRMTGNHDKEEIFYTENMLEKELNKQKIKNF